MDPLTDVSAPLPLLQVYVTAPPELAVSVTEDPAQTVLEGEALMLTGPGFVVGQKTAVPVQPLLFEPTTV